MSRKWMTACLSVCLLAAGVYAGMGYQMKCLPKENAKSCGFGTAVTFGGGMFFDQLTGYCRSCKKFVSITWTRPEAAQAGHMPPQMQIKPKPEPLGEVWDSRTGEAFTIHACPNCKGPFLEIKKLEDLQHCPSCNEAHFGIDPDAPVMAID